MASRHRTYLCTSAKLQLVLSRLSLYSGNTFDSISAMGDERNLAQLRGGKNVRVYNTQLAGRGHLNRTTSDLFLDLASLATAHVEPERLMLVVQRYTGAIDSRWRARM